MKIIAVLIFPLIFPLLSYSQEDSKVDGLSDTLLSLRPAPSWAGREHWVDSVYRRLSIDEKIGQLFMLRAHSNKTRAYHEQVLRQVQQYKPGGLCFFQGGPVRQLSLVNRYQQASSLPMLIAIDGEWGVAMRLDSSLKFPRQMTLGAIHDDSLIYAIGQAIARQCRSVGVNMDFAPVVDVNNNPDNPVINSRSFGEEAGAVARKATMMMKGMQSQGVAACAKHFPGHGDTRSDSHKTLPTVKADLAEMDSIHLLPFKRLIEQGVKAVMVAHLHVPALDSISGKATSLSPLVVGGLLRDSLHFHGLAITDALEMKGVSAYNNAEDIPLMALQAGNDMLLMPPDIDKAVQGIKAALQKGELDSALLESRVKNILAGKYDLGLTRWKPLNSRGLIDSLNKAADRALVRTAYRKALTLLSNRGKILPLKPGNKSIAVVSVGRDTSNAFNSMMKRFVAFDAYALPKRATEEQVKALSLRLKKYDYVLVNVMNTSNSAYRNYGIAQTSVDFVNLLCQQQAVVLNLFANPYAASRFVGSCSPNALLVAYEDNPMVYELAAQAVMGASAIEGHLPVSSGEVFAAGSGMLIPKVRLGYASPEELGFDSDTLSFIDTLVEEGLRAGAYPGAVVLIAKAGEVFYRKAFGSMTYREKQPMSPSTLFDLASITKVMATTNALMRLSHEGLIDIDKTLGFYLPELKGSNKEFIVIRDLLAHQARLTPWIPFYLDAPISDSTLYCVEPRKNYVQVADSLYVISSYKDTIFQRIIASKLLQRKKYRYSDLGMIMMKEIIERQTGCSLDSYCDSVFYRPLGMQHTFFNPAAKVAVSAVAPSEDDRYFRHQLIRNYVHDPAAALMGGVAGHAGLFSTVDDMAVMCQMYLQHGYYCGRRYLDSLVLSDFTRQQFPLNDNRRALGFDKPLPHHEEGGPTSPLVSHDSYGHSGFTGTYFWVDPQYGLLYIFLSNRVYPTAENRKLISMDIRTRIQHEIYRQMGVKWEDL